MKKFVQKNYLHFNSLSLKNACESIEKHLQNKGQLIVTLAGAFSTGECGAPLAKLIKEKKVHAISCTGANLEEAVFRLLGQSKYKLNPNFMDLSPQDEVDIINSDYNRVTDSYIPEKYVIDLLYPALEEVWFAEYENRKGTGKLWHEYFFMLFENGFIQNNLDKDINSDNNRLEDNWLYQAWFNKIPICVPGNCDSTMGNIFAQLLIEDEIESWVIKHDTEYMKIMANWYAEHSKNGTKMGMLTLGGGISADFPQTISPFVTKDLKIPNTNVWDLMVVITMDMSVTAGGFSGCSLNEKITWAKLGLNSKKHLIHSDFSIVFPIIAEYIKD